MRLTRPNIFEILCGACPALSAPTVAFVPTETIPYALFCRWMIRDGWVRRGKATACANPKKVPPPLGATRGRDWSPRLLRWVRRPNDARKIRPTWGAPRSILAHQLKRASRLQRQLRALPRTSNADGSTILTTLTATGVAADVKTAIFYAFPLQQGLWALRVAATKPARDVPERQRRTSLPRPVLLTGFRSRLCVQLSTRWQLRQP